MSLIIIIIIIIIMIKFHGVDLPGEGRTLWPITATAGASSDCLPVKFLETNGTQQMVLLPAGRQADRVVGRLWHHP